MEKNRITCYDKFIGFFRPSYLKNRIKYVKEQIEKDGGMETLLLSEVERRLGITKEVNDNLDCVGYRSGFDKF